MNSKKKKIDDEALCESHLNKTNTFNTDSYSVRAKLALALLGYKMHFPSFRFRRMDVTPASLGNVDKIQGVAAYRLKVYTLIRNRVRCQGLHLLVEGVLGRCWAAPAHLASPQPLRPCHVTVVSLNRCVGV
ncbi:hypothetical protein PoB_005831100 [Plakobranchus ocellatus]|uniref:Uncharacterized protein n=1 Tax=Plakobranchus ocellatus TaxID=259542 RepID=A0AAV4CG66_9GAST|nr:hypothetical protein PoB_005831100 [Plakobranchus ocellatus]